MPRVLRSDYAGEIYHALNRGNAKNDIFFKDADYESFERVVSEGLEKYPIDLLCYQWMSNHWHMVLSPQQDKAMSAFPGWVTMTHTQRYHAPNGTTGHRHVYQGRPVKRLVCGSESVNEELTKKETDALANCVKRGCPFGNENWVHDAAKKQGLELTLRPRGRPKKLY